MNRAATEASAKGTDHIAPLIHYFGGKGRMLPKLRTLYPARFSRYFEPFIGGGAVLFDLRPRKATLNDRNAELVNLYRAVQNNAEEVAHEYGAIWAPYEAASESEKERVYYFVRDADREAAFKSITPAARAARFLFICYTGFNGRFQVNKRGFCNTTWGKRLRAHGTLLERIRAVGDYFQGDVEILEGDGGVALSKAKEGDFVFLDPPYVPLSKTAKFTEYTPGGFGFADQVRLMGAMEAATERGVRWAYTNGDSAWLREWFSRFPGCRVELVPMRRMVAGDATARGLVNELLVLNYDPKKEGCRG